MTCEAEIKSLDYLGLESQKYIYIYVYTGEYEIMGRELLR